MRKSVFTLAAIATLTLSGCLSSQQQNELGGALGGAAVGLIGAKAFGANDNIAVAATVIGASVGAGMAQPKQCTFAHADGTRTTGPCPN